MFATVVIVLEPCVPAACRPCRLERCVRNWELPTGPFHPVAKRHVDSRLNLCIVLLIMWGNSPLLRRENDTVEGIKSLSLVFITRWKSKHLWSSHALKAWGIHLPLSWRHGGFLRLGFHGTVTFQCCSLCALSGFLFSRFSPAPIPSAQSTALLLSF